MQMKAVYCFLVFLVGCAQVPRPSTYPYTFQQQMQAAHHWRVLANQVAEQAAAAIKASPDASIKPVYVRSDDLSPFGQAYRSFLITELIQHGIVVSPYHKPCTVRDIFAPLSDSNHFEICWNVQVLVHYADRIKPPFPLQNTLLAGLGFGLAEAWNNLNSGAAGAVTAFSLGPLLDASQGLRTGPLPHSEAIITTAIMDGGFIMDQKSDIFYINDMDRQHYWSRPDAPQKTYAVVGCPPKDSCRGQ